MPKIVNENYKSFLEGHLFECFTRDHLDAVLANIKDLYSKRNKSVRDYTRAARALMICLWLSGARPAEALGLTSGDVIRMPGSKVSIYFKTLKRGKPRTIILPSNDKFVKEFTDYATSFGVESFYLFHMFRTTYVRTNIVKKWKRTNKATGMVETVTKAYEKPYSIESGKLYYYFKRWVGPVFDVYPYYLRHSRLTKIAEDGSIEDVRQFKGAKTYDSCLRYMQSTEKQKIKVGKSAVK
jgi:integrase